MSITKKPSLPTIHGQANSWSVMSWTGQLADKSTR